MVSDTTPVASQTEYNPEEAAMLTRSRVFVSMRWLAILGVLLSTFIASLVFHIEFSTTIVYIICGFMVLYNLVFFFQARDLKKQKPGSVSHKMMVYSDIHITLDLITLTFLVHFTGGIENPFIFYFVFHAIVASITFRYRATYIVATLALAMVCTLVTLEYTGVISHHNLVGFADPTLYHKVSYVLPVLIALATVLYGATYMVTSISGELKKRQRQVVQLGNQLLLEKTDEIAREREMQNRLSIAYEQLSQTNRELRESQEQLIRAEKLSSLGQLASSIAHEINNPLSGVIVYTQLLGKKIAANDLSKEVALDYLSKMNKELVRSAKLITNLLDFSRQSTPAISEADVNKIIERALSLPAHAADLQHVQIIKEFDNTLPPISADSDQLQQVFTNMILNAIQAMRNGGTLTIRTCSSVDYVKIEFQDTGIGISPENMSKLFTPFFTTKPEVKGVGLGLAVAYGIIQRHNGKIDVQSKVGEGSTFIIELPIMHVQENLKSNGPSSRPDSPS